MAIIKIDRDLRAGGEALLHAGIGGEALSDQVRLSVRE